MKVKNLEFGKTVLAYAVAGFVGFVGFNIASNVIVEDNINMEKNTDNDNSNKDLNTVTGGAISIDTASIETPVVTIDENKKLNVEPTKAPKLTYKKGTYGYVKKSLSLRKNPTTKKKVNIKLPSYQKVKMLEKEDNWVLAKYKGTKGYINEDNIKKINEDFVDIDISEQKLKVYDKDGNMVLKTDIVSGTELIPDRRSDRGAFEIYYKTTKTHLEGPGYISYVDYFEAYNDGEGLHDATWRTKFGGNIYKYIGSHGCINLPPKVAPKVFKKTSVGTKVLVHD